MIIQVTEHIIILNCLCGYHVSAATSYTTEVASTTGLKEKESVSELSGLQPVSLKGTYEHPIHSCKDIPSGSPSGEYWLLNKCNKTPVKVHCDMTRSCCNDTGGWTRVANLNMTNTSHQCPLGFRLLTAPRRLCGVSSTGCVSTRFITFAINYLKVCGKVIGYQHGTPNAFSLYSASRTPINSHYVDGVSLTHGNESTKKHIWTFAAGSDETSAGPTVCPCSRTDLRYAGRVPPYVGQDYFCDTANHVQGPTSNTPFYEDSLWDGDGCLSGSNTCCCFNNPPWFCKQLPQPTTDDI